MKLKQMEWDFGQRFRDAGTITENETSTRKSGKVKNGKLGKKDMKELASKNRKLSWEQSKSTQKRVPEQDQELERLSSQEEDKTGLGEGSVVHQQEGVEDGRVVHTEPAGHPGPEQSVQLDA